MINYASEIKERVTMLEVCDRYGIAVSRAGFANCVFHAGDRTASMRIYDGTGGFHCFGCGESGDVISFVQKYFNLPFTAALTKLNDDFVLGLPLNSNPNDERKRFTANISAWKHKQEAEAHQKRLKSAQTAYDISLNAYAYLDRKRLINAPASPQEEIREEYAGAIRRLPLAKYQLDTAEMELVQIEQEKWR